MNGGEQKIYSKIVEIATKQEERHVENKTDLKIIFRDLKGVKDAIAALPCGIHTERMKGLKEKVTLQWWVISIVIILGMVLGVWAKIVMAG